MWASHFSIALLNFCQALPKESIYHMKQDEAYELLKKLSNEDFGNDPLAWEKWGKEHDMFYPGWGGILSVVRDRPAQ